MIAQSGLTRPAGHNMLLSAAAASLLLLAVEVLGQAEVDIEVLSHICKYGVHTDGRRYRQSVSHQSVIIITPRVL